MQKEISVDLTQYIYDLPHEKIAFEGTEKRENSKLLSYKNGDIHDYTFSNIVDLIPSKSTLVFNNTKVIPARLFMQKSTGATIELFLLKPATQEISKALEATQKSTWQCMIGNLKKWKEGETLKCLLTIENQEVELIATLLDRENKIVEFAWKNEQISFAQLIESLGNTPLPPYIKRAVKESDKQRYQTVYSKIDGAVAAPTAGLHFTDGILKELAKKGVKQEHLTLHVGAGTFMPIKSASVQEHPMHNETMIVPVSLIKSISSSELIISVGTTSMRTLESLYWYGVKLIKNPSAPFKIEKLAPYQNDPQLPSKQEALEAILRYAKNNELDYINGSTEIFIFPGYKFKVCDGLITNFHQPESTLILLVAAFIGDNWKNVYQHALSNHYRFLSFGDSSLLFPD